MSQPKDQSILPAVFAANGETCLMGDGIAPPPVWIKPQLAALVTAPPGGPGWLHEIKLDGYRMHARIAAGSVKLLTRRGND